MGKAFDDLSKALARGAGRRSAIGRLVGGADGAAVAAFLPGRSAAADEEDVKNAAKRLCQEYCDQLGGSKRARRACAHNCEEIFNSAGTGLRSIRFRAPAADCLAVCINSTRADCAEYTVMNFTQVNCAEINSTKLSFS